MLCIMGEACLALVLLTLLDSSRVVVGNGSIPATGIYRTLISSIAERREKSESVVPDLRPKFTLPNPLACLKPLLLRNFSVVLICNGIYYTMYFCIQASLSTLFIEIYNYESLRAGLIYIPFGAACLVGTFVWGWYIVPHTDSILN